MFNVSMDVSMDVSIALNLADALSFSDHAQTELNFELIKVCNSWQ